MLVFSTSKGVYWDIIKDTLWILKFMRNLEGVFGFFKPFVIKWPLTQERPCEWQPQSASIAKSLYIMHCFGKVNFKFLDIRHELALPAPFRGEDWDTSWSTVLIESSWLYQNQSFKSIWQAINYQFKAVLHEVRVKFIGSWLIYLSQFKFLMQLQLGYDKMIDK